ncbi:MAG: hypothetical protein FWC17_02655 [Treponema sp.]|nr:hypothetical protein [Treponema sp.]
MKRLITAVLLMTFIFLNIFSQLGDGKFQWSGIVYAMAMPFAVFTGCAPEPTPELPPPEPVEITLTFPTVTLPSPTLNFKPTNLPDKITYTVSDGTTTWNSKDGFNGVVNSGSYPALTMQTFTQVFYKKGSSEPIGSQIIKTTVGWASANFVSIVDTNDVVLDTIPSVELTY